jgi:hypothetical protein
MSFWWASDVRLSDVSYFRQLSQQWRTVAQNRKGASGSQPATADKIGSREAALRMAYLVYWTKADITEAEFMANGDQAQSAEFRSLDDALGWARHVNRIIGISWLIACPSGASLARAEIEEIVRKREADFAERPLARAVTISSSAPQH